MDVVNSKRYSNWRSFYLVGIPLFVIICLSSIYFYERLKENEYNHVRSQLHDSVAIATTPIEEELQDHVLTFKRMGKRWLIQRNFELSIQDAVNYFNDAPVFQAIEFVNNNMVTQWVVPAQSNQNVKEVDLSKLDTRAQHIQNAKETKQPTISDVFSLIQGPEGFLIIVPIVNVNQVEGYIIGVVDAKKFFNEIFKKGLGNNYGLTIYQNNKPIFAINSPVINPYLVEKSKIQLYNMTWEIYIWPTQRLLNELLTPLPLVSLISGLLVATLLLFIFYFYDISRATASRLGFLKRDAEEQSKRVNTILETVKEGFISIDKDSNVLEWNPYAEEMFGWTKKEIIGKKMYNYIIPPQYREMHKQGLQRFLEIGEQHVFNKILELPAVRRDQTEFPVELLIFPIKLNDIYTFYAFVRDISQRKKNEADVRRFETIVENSDDAIISADLDGNILTWNKGAEDLYGYKLKDVIGKQVSLLYPLDREKELGEILERIKTGEHIHNHDARRRSKDGRIIPVSITITPIADKENNIIGVLSIARDITERHKIEKMKNEFISIVSHELRTPLTSIRGSIGLLESEKICGLNSKARELLEIANNNCDRLIRLINDILDIEKIEAGKMEFNFKILDLNKLIQSSINANEGVARKNNIKIILEAERDFEIFGDADRLTQVMTNLLSNAIRYSPQNGIIKVNISSFGDKVKVSVTDAGPGIPIEAQNKIFGKFTQADSSDSRTKGGTGLGLNISKAIIERMGGRIAFVSELGKGTTFYFDLPLERARKISPRLTKTPSVKHKILICDSNLKSANYLKRLLESKKIEADIATTAKQAKQLLFKHFYTAITIDLLLPDQDGIAFIRDLREHEKTKNIPVIAISVRPIEGSEQLNGDGFQVIDWLEKPLGKDQSNKILEHINNKFGDTIPNVLHVEDDEDVSRLISYILQDSAKVWSTNSVENAKKLLKEEEFDLVILDLNLPDGYGTALLPCINKRTKKTIPVIVFSIDELDRKYSHLVKESLLKSVATNEQLFQAIDSAINITEE